MGDHADDAIDDSLNGYWVFGEDDLSDLSDADFGSVVCHRDPEEQRLREFARQVLKRNPKLFKKRKKP